MQPVLLHKLLPASYASQQRVCEHVLREHARNNEVRLVVCCCCCCCCCWGQRVGEEAWEQGELACGLV